MKVFVVLFVLMSACSATNLRSEDAGLGDSPPDAHVVFDARTVDARSVDARVVDARVVDAWRADAYRCVFRPGRARDTTISPEVSDCLGISRPECIGCHRDGDNVYLFGFPESSPPPSGIDLDGACIWCD